MDQSQQELPNLLVLMGHPRSGTSILNRVCDSHSDIVMTREFMNMVLPQSYLEHFSMVRKNFLWKTPLLFAPGSFRWKKLISLLFLTRYLFWLLIYSRGYITPEDLQKTLGRIFPEQRLVGDKKPLYLWKLTNFEQANTKYVLIYRDGRDVVSSALKRSWAGKDNRFSTASSAAKKWVKAVELMEQYRDKVHIIRYEDLVSNPDVVLQRLAKYLEIDPDGFKPLMINDSSVGKYKNNLTYQQLSDVIEIAGPSLERLGYATK